MLDSTLIGDRVSGLGTRVLALENADRNSAEDRLEIKARLRQLEEAVFGDDGPTRSDSPYPPSSKGRRIAKVLSALDRRDERE